MELRPTIQLMVWSHVIPFVLWFGEGLCACCPHRTTHSTLQISDSKCLKTLGISLSLLLPSPSASTHTHLHEQAFKIP